MSLSHHGKRKNLRKSQTVNSVCFAETLERRLLMANGFTVSSLADVGAGTLRAAITSANATSGTNIISFSNGLTGTINLGSALPVITNNTTINGPGANLVTVNGNAHGSVFSIKSAITVEIENLTITGGGGTGTGGGIFLDGGNLTIANSAISGNTANSFGGGIYDFVGTLNVIDSTISGNSTGGSGGGILFNYGTLSVTNSTIADNSVPGNGGGFYGRGTLNFTDSTISGNSAGTTGGLGITPNSASCTVEGTIIAANAGGDFANKSSKAATGANDLIGDGSDNGVFTNSVRGTVGNPLNPLLGALANNGGPTQTLALLPGSPALNTGAGFNGITADQRGDVRPSSTGIDIGAFQVQVLTVNTVTDPATPIHGILSLREAIAESNALGGTQTINFITGQDGTISLASQLPAFTSNITLNGSGANLLTVNGQGHGSVFTVNSGITSVIENLTITGGNASPKGGGIDNEGTLTLTNSAISGNTAVVFGAGIYSGIGSTLTIIDSTISGNSVGQTAGGINFNYATVFVTNSTITGNSAAYGGGIYGQGALTCTDSTISGNSATSLTGGLYILNGSCTVDGTIIAANAGGDFFNKSSTAATGASDLIGDGSDNGVFTSSLRGTTANPLKPLLGALTNNGGPTQTMALLTGSPALGTGASFNGITTDQRGAGRPSSTGIDIGAFQVQVLTVNTLTDPATQTAGTLSLRQAITAANSSGFAQTINFSSGLTGTINVASQLPHFTSNITLDGPGASVLTVNGQGHGNVFYINSGVTAVIEDLTITGGFIGAGGGIYDYKGNLTVANSDISGNTVTNGGGGLYSYVGELTVVDSTISGNSAGFGGGIAVNYGSLAVTNSTITGNSAGNYAGGIYGRGNLSLTDTTISGNSAGATGGLVFGPSIIPTSLTVDGTIIAANAGGDFANNNSKAATGSNDLIGDGSDGGVFTNSLRGTKANPLNPLLGALTNNGGPTQTLALLTGSPALNTGASFNGITTDQRGAPRPSNTGIDIGAFQEQFLTVNSLIDPLTPPNGTVTLRLAITDANFSGFAQTINFSSGLAGTINLQTALPNITSNITIDGPGANVLAVNGQGNGSVFTINSGVTSVMENLTITGGNSSGDGGGILNSGSLTVANSTISQNTANILGGGIYTGTGSALTVIDSTVSGNTASNFGGGIKLNYAAVFVTNSTITGNSALGGGGIYGRGALTCTDCTISGNSSGYGSGLYISNGSCTVDGTIIAANAGGDFLDRSATPATGSNDLIGDGSDNGVLANSLRGSKANPLNPMLSPVLENFGGPTPTLALQAGSPALNTGANFNNLNTDQRGFARPTTTGIDIGADQGALFAGDTNFDGTVNLTDLLTLLNNYGETGKGWTQGDFNFDGTVNLTDLLSLLNHYGESANDTSIAAPAAAVVSYKAKSSPFASEPLALNSAGGLSGQTSSSLDVDGEILEAGFRAIL